MRAHVSTMSAAMKISVQPILAGQSQTNCTDGTVSGQAGFYANADRPCFKPRVPKSTFQVAD
jgi:hypothetical protein